jgi:CRP-like cAMP-binding protein
MQQNAFLAGLRTDDVTLVRPHLSRKDLHAGDNLGFCGDPIEEVVFPHSGLVVMTAPLGDEAGAGIALIGCEGFVGGLPAAASALASCDSEVLISGQASRMSASAFRHVLNHSPTLRQWTAQFNNAMMAQAQRTAVCNAAHSVEARICRWLLDVCDRSGEDRIPFTQGTWGRLLAVRRTTVTLVAGRLEAAGLINCRRGYMNIVDRKAIEEHCCECYGQLKSHAARPNPVQEHRTAIDGGAALAQALPHVMSGS